MKQKYKIGVMGSAGEKENSGVALLSYRIGKEIALQGAVLFTGGCPGIPHCAVRGAIEEGGTTVAISPAINRRSHVYDFSYPVDSETIIFTGMGNKGRNVVLVRSCDACIFVSGGIGTLNEFTIAFDDLAENNVLGILEGSGGFSNKYMELAGSVEKRTRATIICEADPKKLVERIIELLKQLETNDNLC